MLELLGMQELIATDIDDYVRIATGLCSDSGWRAAAAARLRERSASLFDDANPIESLEAFFINAANASIAA